MTQPQISRTRRLERTLGDWMRARLPRAVAEFTMFTLKQAWASLFGALLLVGMILSARSGKPTGRWPAMTLC